MSNSAHSPNRRRANASAATLKRLVLGAMMAAMSVVIGILCKNFLNFGGGLFRITFENLPIILAGIVFLAMNLWKKSEKAIFIFGAILLGCEILQILLLNLFLFY